MNSARPVVLSRFGLNVTPGLGVPVVIASRFQALISMIR